MKYAVTWKSDFEDNKAETSDFWYTMENDLFLLPYTSAKNGEDAARKFLSKEYDNIDWDCTDWKQDTYNYMMEIFIRYSVYGDSVLERYVKQNDIDALIEELQEYYLECMMMDGKVTIHVEGDNCWYSKPGDDDQYIKKVQEKFCSDRLISLLTEEEKKEVFIETNLGDLMVIHLESF